METPFGNNLDNFSGVPTPAFPGMNGNRGQGEFGFEQNNLDPYNSMGMNNQINWQNGSQQGQQVSQNQTVIICYHLTPDRLSVDQLFNLFSFYGLVTRIKIMQNKPDCCLVTGTCFTDVHFRI